MPEERDTQDRLQNQSPGREKSSAVEPEGGSEGFPVKCNLPSPGPGRYWEIDDQGNAVVTTIEPDASAGKCESDHVDQARLTFVKEDTFVDSPQKQGDFKGNNNLTGHLVGCEMVGSTVECRPRCPQRRET